MKQSASLAAGQSANGRLAREIDGAVLLLAHPSLSGLNSGDGTGASTAWSNTVRSRLYLERPTAEDGEKPDDGARILTTKKANYAATGSEIRLRWQHGVFVPEGATVAGFVQAIDERARERQVEEIFLSCLREVRARGQYASDSTASRDRYAPKLFRTLKAGRNCSAKELKFAMSRLFDAGEIRVESVRNANRSYRRGCIVMIAIAESFSCAHTQRRFVHTQDKLLKSNSFGERAHTPYTTYRRRPSGGAPAYTRGSAARVA